MKTKTRNSVVVAALCAIMLASGCFGPMNASSHLKTWNREIENRWLGEGVFLALRVIYVYPVVFLGDVLIFNSIEFWGGENPISPVDPARHDAVNEMDAKRQGPPWRDNDEPAEAEG